MPGWREETGPLSGFWPSRWSSLPLPVMTEEGTLFMKKIEIGSIPELSTSVGMQGSAKQKEVGGPMCLGALIGIALMLVGSAD
jgi:hypothetical protein